MPSIWKSCGKCRHCIFLHTGMNLFFIRYQNFGNIWELIFLYIILLVLVSFQILYWVKKPSLFLLPQWGPQLPVVIKVNQLLIVLFFCFFCQNVVKNSMCSLFIPLSFMKGFVPMLEYIPFFRKKRKVEDDKKSNKKQKTEETAEEKALRVGFCP